jgi:hypothetical protein
MKSAPYIGGRAGGEGWMEHERYKKSQERGKKKNIYRKPSVIQLSIN